MKFAAVVGSVVEQRTPALAICLPQGTQLPLSGPAGELDLALNGQLSACLSDGDFRGKPNEVLVLYGHQAQPARRVILVGLGETGNLTLNTIREAVASVAKRARALGANALHIALPDLGSDAPSGLDAVREAQAIAEAALLGLYRFTELKTQDEDLQPDPDMLTVVLPEADLLDVVKQGLETGRVVAESTMLTRDLVNRPANIASPAHIVEVAHAIAAETEARSTSTHSSGSPTLRVSVLDKPALADLGMHLFLSVNQGGKEPARLIILEHNADRQNLPTIVLVGKGITFDTGGISLKSSQGMERMKGDMAGAAAVLGALRAAALLDVPLHVVGLAPLTDNMPDAQATKPGDVVASLKGLTVEIVNTDAEGRLILADALTYAGEFSPDAIIDIATLTGGRIVALGDHAAAVMGDQDLVDRLVAAGDAAHERVWQLPLFKEYGKQMDSSVADLKNTGGRAASSITAGYFLSRFVPEGVKWAHIDIAGLALRDKSGPYVPEGATGFGAKLLVELLRSWVA